MRRNEEDGRGGEGRGGEGDIKGSKCCDEKILILIAITTHLYAPYLEMS